MLLEKLFEEFPDLQYIQYKEKVPFTEREQEVLEVRFPNVVICFVKNKINSIRIKERVYSSAEEADKYLKEIQNIINSCALILLTVER